MSNPPSSEHEARRRVFESAREDAEGSVESLEDYFEHVLPSFVRDEMLRELRNLQANLRIMEAENVHTWGIADHTQRVTDMTEKQLKESEDNFQQICKLVPPALGEMGSMKGWLQEKLRENFSRWDADLPLLDEIAKLTGLPDTPLLVLLRLLHEYRNKKK